MQILGGCLLMSPTERPGPHVHAALSRADGYSVWGLARKNYVKRSKSRRLIFRLDRFFDLILCSTSIPAEPQIRPFMGQLLGAIRESKDYAMWGTGGARP